MGSSNVCRITEKLDNLVVIVDNNGLQIDGPIDEVNSPYPIKLNSKHLTLMWLKLMVTTLIRSLMRSNRQKNAKEMPTAIIMKTIKGKGVSFHGESGFMAWFCTK